MAALSESDSFRTVSLSSGSGSVVSDNSVEKNEDSNTKIFFRILMIALTALALGVASIVAVKAFGGSLIVAIAVGAVVTLTVSLINHWYNNRGLATHQTFAAPTHPTPAAQGEPLPREGESDAYDTGIVIHLDEVSEASLVKPEDITPS